MKAIDSGKIIGVARSRFGASQGSKTTMVKTRKGKAQEIAIGTTRVEIQISYYAPPASKTLVPQFLQNLSNSIAGKEVTFIRIIISIIVLVAAILVVGVLLYAGIRNSLLSIGRNPLAQKGIYKALLQVLITGIGILALSLGSVYIIFDTVEVKCIE